MNKVTGLGDVVKDPVVWKFTLYVASSAIHQTKEHYCQTYKGQHRLDIRAKIGEDFFFPLSASSV